MMVRSGGWCHFRRSSRGIGGCRSGLFRVGLRGVGLCHVRGKPVLGGRCSLEAAAVVCMWFARVRFCVLSAFLCSRFFLVLLRGLSSSIGYEFSRKVVYIQGEGVVFGFRVFCFFGVRCGFWGIKIGFLRVRIFL